MGPWFEMARLPTRFEEEGCSDVCALYSLHSGSVQVQNTCTATSGARRMAVGTAEMYEPGKLTVSFAWFIPPWLLSANYYVIQTDYSIYALVGTPDRSCLWILARAQHMSTELYDTLLSFAHRLGFDTARVKKTPMSSTNV